MSSWSGVVDFAVVFGLIWIGWFNGAQFHELHCREDGRNLFVHLPATGSRSHSPTRSCSRCSSGSGPPCTEPTPEYRPGAFRYLAGLAVAIGALPASAAMEDDARLAVWAAVVVGSIALVVVYILRSSDDSLGIRATPSMAERYGLFIIIVSARWS